MKILHVNKFFDLRGGTETYLHALMAMQQAAGHEVHIFSTRSSDNLPSGDATSFVKRFDFTKSEGAVRDAEKSSAFIWNREARRGMARMLREIRPDVVHLHNIYHHLSSSILAPIRASGIPCVQTLHDYKLACPNYKMLTEGAPCERCKGGRYFEAVAHHCLTAGTAGNILAAFEMGMTKLTQSYERTVRLFLCPSQFMATKMAEWGEPPSKMRVLPNPVALPDVVAARDGGYLLAVGRLSSEKGFDTVVRAAARTPDVEIRIAGIGPEEHRLKQLATDLKAANVSFLGFLRKPELTEARRHAAALLTPSIWYENAPYAVLEALADGLPVIASRIGGLPELVESGTNGLLVEPGDADAWCAAFNAFFLMPEGERQRLATASRRAAEDRYGWPKHLINLSAAYREAGAPV
ncbi:MAG: glycosyltransferase [Patescibacteria group bacterium]